MTVEAFNAPEPAQAALKEVVLETKSLAALPDLPKPANPDVVEADGNEPRKIKPA